jgi:uncharacterized protein
MSWQVLDSIHDVSAREWNALNLQHQPFLRHEFLAALEDTGCATRATGWTPQHLLLRDDAAKQLLGAVPLYLKTHSFGEFVFDFNWAEAFERAFRAHDAHYYPRLVSAIPFTPANGPRLLCAITADETSVRLQLQHGLQALTDELGFSSCHMLFPLKTEHDVLAEAGWLSRSSCQFHWRNRGYQCMDDFLEQFRADKRKKAKRERRRVLQEYGITYQTLFGAELSPTQWQMVFGFSENTFAQHGHEHYLNAEFLQRVARALPEQVMVKIAEHQGSAVAAAIFFLSDDTLFGRYWGASGQFDSLHFETCYYQGIEFCIARDLQCFEPGTQGEHKVARGFEPTLCYSAHYLREPRFRRAVADHLAWERQAVHDYVQQVKQHVPFHRDQQT